MSHPMRRGREERNFRIRLPVGVTVNRFSLELVDAWVEFQGQKAVCIATFDVLERENGQTSTSINLQRELPPGAEMAQTIRMLLREAALHEIDENIRVDGELVFDPHAGERRVF